MLPTPMSRRAILVFAENAGHDLARRRLPRAALPFMRLRACEKNLPLKADVHIFGSARPALNVRRFHAQRGTGFGERFENAIETLAALGYEEIVAVGRDCPDLSTNDIAHAFEELQSNRLVLGPDHRGGCYLIAFRTRDRDRLRGVKWRRNTDCAQLVARAGKSSVFLLPVKLDIDSWADVRLAASTGHCLARLAGFLLATMAALQQALPSLVHAATRFIRLHGQMPPPRAAAV